MEMFNILLSVISWAKCITVFTDVPAGLWASIIGSNDYNRKKKLFVTL